MIHNIHVDIARIAGPNAAAILEQVYVDCKKNVCTNDNFLEGRHWVNRTLDVFHMVHPYLTCNQIRTAINKLEKNNLLISIQPNKSNFDNTKWYCLSDKAIKIMEEGGRK